MYPCKDIKKEIILYKNTNIQNNHNAKKRVSYYEKVHQMLRDKQITEEESSSLLKEHEIKLEKKRKYKCTGEIINSVEELTKQEYVYCFGNRPIHTSFLFSMPFSLIYNMLCCKKIKKASKKEINNE